MTLHVGEEGKTLRFAAGFDLSSNTELTLTFELPDGTTVTKTKSGGEVTIGTGDMTDPDLGQLKADQYVEYITESGFLSQAGTWQSKLIYTNTAPTPDDIFVGDCVSFPVVAAFDCTVISEAKPYTFISVADTSRIFHASFTSSINADSGAGVLTPSATSSTAPVVSGGNLILDTGNSGDRRWVRYESLANADNGDVGCIRIKIKTNYSGTPPNQSEWFFRLTGDVSSSASDDDIVIRHGGGAGNLHVQMFHAPNDSRLVSAFWAPVSGVEYELEINWDYTVSEELRFFVNGVQHGSTRSLTGFSRATNDNTYFQLGAHSVSSSFDNNFDVLDLKIFGVVQHTSNYTP